MKAGLSPLRGLSLFSICPPTAYAVGCILTPLRGYIPTPLCGYIPTPLCGYTPTPLRGWIPERTACTSGAQALKRGDNGTLIGTSEVVPFPVGTSQTHRGHLGG